VGYCLRKGTSKGRKNTDALSYYDFVAMQLLAQAVTIAAAPLVKTIRTVKAMQLVLLAKAIRLIPESSYART